VPFLLALEWEGFFRFEIALVLRWGLRFLVVFIGLILNIKGG
jgi:hypothetical protein